MDAPQPGQELQNIVVRPVYLRAVNAIVQPEQQLPCSLYFFREWLPRLGSLRWSLVLALRHICSVRQPDGSSRGEVSRSQLASVLGVHEVTISRVLATTRSESQQGWRVLQPSGEEDTETRYLAKFIPRLRYKYERDLQTGTTRRIGYIIDVVMDDPLIPEDERRLAMVLAEQILSGQDYQSPSVLSIDCEEQIASSHESVKNQFVSLARDVVSHSVTSPFNQDKQIAPSAGLKAQFGPGLTLNNKLNYHGITIPLDLRDRNRIRRALAPMVKYATDVLHDDHSTGMFYSTLLQLYPDSLNIFIEALEIAVQVGSSNSTVNLGAVFVKTMKDIAEERGVSLRLGRASSAGSVSAVEKCEDVTLSVEKEEQSGQESRNVFMPAVGMSGLQVWQSVLEDLRGRVSRADYDMWLKNCCVLRIEGDRVIVGAPNRFTRDWVKQKLEDQTTKAVSRVLGRQVTLRYEVIASSVVGSDVDD